MSLFVGKGGKAFDMKLPVHSLVFNRLKDILDSKNNSEDALFEKNISVSVKAILKSRFQITTKSFRTFKASKMAETLLNTIPTKLRTTEKIKELKRQLAKIAVSLNHYHTSVYNIVSTIKKRDQLLAKKKITIRVSKYMNK